MDFISLFAGIGGLDLGFERAGMRCVAQVEKDPFCQKILTKHWPHVLKIKDVKDAGKHNLPTADIIAGGFPCQPHSHAGKRRGKEDDRNLWPEYFRIVDELRPQYVVGENVPGIVTTILDEVISDLETIGYTCQTFIIPACAFNAPHRRDRVWIIANSKSVRHVYREPEIIATQAREYAQHDPSASDSNATNASGQRLQRNEFSGASSKGARSPRSITQLSWNEYWPEIATRLCRVDDGIPRRLDRIRTLGNAVVPQVAEFIARSILQAETAPNTA